MVLDRHERKANHAGSGLPPPWSRWRCSRLAWPAPTCSGPRRPEPTILPGAQSPTRSAAGPATQQIERRTQLGFPDAPDTGVPAGTEVAHGAKPGIERAGLGLRPARLGQGLRQRRVLSDLNIPCNVSVTASDVTIMNVRITVGGANSIGIGLRHAKNVTIEDSTISGLNTAAAG